MRSRTALLVLAVTSASCRWFEADTTPPGTLRQAVNDVTLAAVADTYVKSGAPNSNSGTETLVRLQSS
ncbi:MAG: hypothetical protein AB2A00_16760, partial [Myxococcota bacterium]